MILCADDYGQAPGVSEAIRLLLARRRLSATTCMTVGGNWTTDGQLLREAEVDADIGLHVTLTDQVPLGEMPRLAPTGRLPSISRLILLAYRRALDPDEIRAEVTRQLDAFVEGLHRLPDFIDGHQHAHQLPIVRDVILEYMECNKDAYLRVCHESPAAIKARGDPLRTLIISELGRTLKRRARARGIRTNDSFRGVYDFASDQPYGDFFAKFAQGATPRTIIMCHPGFVDDELRRIERLTYQREREYAFFAGPAFLPYEGRLNRYGAEPSDGV